MDKWISSAYVYNFTRWLTIVYVVIDFIHAPKIIDMVAHSKRCFHETIFNIVLDVRLVFLVPRFVLIISRQRILPSRDLNSTKCLRSRNTSYVNLWLLPTRACRAVPSTWSDKSNENLSFDEIERSIFQMEIYSFLPSSPIFLYWFHPTDRIDKETIALSLIFLLRKDDDSFS